MSKSKSLLVYKHQQQKHTVDHSHGLEQRLGDALCIGQDSNLSTWEPNGLCCNLALLLQSKSNLSLHISEQVWFRPNKSSF